MKEADKAYDIQMDEPSEEFFECWRAAGSHLQELLKAEEGEGGDWAWLKGRLEPPFLEHISFRLGNQLFFLRIEDADRRVTEPGSRLGLGSIADGCNGHPCLMPMRNGPTGWDQVNPGWGLVDARTGGEVIPPGMVTADPIEMTDWEVHDFAVQFVRDQLQEEGRRVTTVQGNPDVDPSLWFAGDDGLEWVVIRAVRYPEVEAPAPEDWDFIADTCAHLSRIGNFASVSVASSDDAFDPEHSAVVPLWRGKEMRVKYQFGTHHRDADP